ncbi:MAG TPA: metal ABC transporter permease [Chloroflexota bacterium]|nr:metal ABC transporter permease [Chloroflexota bacterium]
MLTFLLDPFRYDFFVRGLIVATVVGGLCGLVGTFVVLRRMSYIGHGLSHSVFGGAVISYVMGWNFYLGAGAWGVASAALIGWTARRRQIGADAAIGIVTTAAFAIGVAIISRARRFTRNFDAALFGNVLGTTPEDVFVIVGVTVLVLVLIFFSYKQLLFMTFDPEVAPLYGVPDRGVDALLSLILAATVIASMQILGVTMIAASIVVPAVSARLLTDSFPRMLLLAAAIGVLCGLVGLLLSYYLDVAPGATVVLTAASTFLVVLTATSLRRRLRTERARRGAARLNPAQVSDLFD